MECSSERIFTVQLTLDEAEAIKEEMIKILSNYKSAPDFKALNTLNNVISVELTRAANSNYYD